MKRKITLVCEIVDWTHRYNSEGLKGGGWCLKEVERLMMLSRAEVYAEWKRVFNAE